MRIPLCFVMLVSGLGVRPAAGQFRTPEWKNFHNSTYVGEEAEAARVALFRASEHLEAQRPREAGRELLRLLHSEARGMVRYGERLVLPLERAVALQLAQLPPDVLETLRGEEEGAAERALDPRRVERLSLRRFEVAMRHPLSRRSAAAIYDLGQAALLDADFGGGAAYFEEIVCWPSVFAPDLKNLAAARLAECLAFLGEEPRSGSLLTWPQGSVPGVEPSTVASWLARAAKPTPEPDPRWSTLLGSNDRSTLPALGAADPVPTFSFPIVRGEQTWMGSNRPRPKRFFTPGPTQVPGFPRNLPLVVGGVLYSVQRNTLLARDLVTGHDLFAPLRFDFDLHIDPRLYAVDVDQVTASIHDNQLFLSLEVIDRQHAAPVRFGALYSIDLSRQGYITWGVQTFGRDPEDPLHGWVFGGPAELVSGQLLVPAARMGIKETSSHLFAFDPQTGAYRRDLFLGRASAVARYADRFSTETPRLVRPSPLAVRRGSVYVCTNLGVVAAVRARDLSLTWLYRYNRLVPIDSRRYTREVFHVTGGWPGRAPLALEDRLLVSPADSRYLYSLARWPNAEGDLILADPVEKETRLAWIGADRQRLYFLVQRGTRHAVQATDHSGGVLWETPPLPAEEPVIGLPAQSDRFLFLPTDRRIYRLDLERDGYADLVIRPPPATGTPLPKQGTFGDLVVTQDRLISQSNLFVHVYRVAK